MSAGGWDLDDERSIEGRERSPLVLRRSRVTRAEALARTLEYEVIGHLGPGDRIGTKDELRRRFGVAVATMNEAVRLMEMRGVITARPGPGGGLFVTDTSVRAAATRLMLGLHWGHATMADCLEVRSVLEPPICRHAADEHRPRDISHLRSIVERLEAATADPRAFSRINWELHRRVAIICRNPPLQTMYMLLCDFLDAGLSDLEFDVIMPERVAVHRRLIDAIEARDMSELDAALAEHAALSPLTSETPP